MSENIKRRHHYVWRRYLRAWADNEKIFCLRENKIFNPNLMGIAQQRDFYKLNILEETEIQFVYELAIKNSPKNMVAGHEKLLYAFSLVSKLQDLLGIIATGENESKAKEAVELYIHNMEEELHCYVERIGDKYLDDLLNENTDFFNTQKGFEEFIYYLNVQNMRTKKMRESVITAFSLHNSEINIASCWNVLTHIFSLNSACGFCLERDNYKLVLIRNNSNVDFITGDQPVINIFGLDESSIEPPERLAFYYPISPKLAILVIENQYFQGQKELVFDEKSVNSHNQAIIDSSFEQVFASNKNTLENLMVKA